MNKIILFSISASLLYSITTFAWVCPDPQALNVDESGHWTAPGGWVSKEPAKPGQIVGFLRAGADNTTNNFKGMKLTACVYTSTNELEVQLNPPQKSSYPVTVGQPGSGNWRLGGSNFAACISNNRFECPFGLPLRK